MAEDSAGGDDANSKVGRLIEKYDLEQLDRELIDRWTAHEDERSSLRELADFFNQRMLASTMKEAGIDAIEGEVENTYRLLTDDDVSVGNRTEVHNRLDRHGIDVDELESEFVSHQAIHTFLTKYRNVDLGLQERTSEERLENERVRVTRLQSRTEAVAQDSVNRLKNGDHLRVNDPSVLVDVRVFCESCGIDLRIDELLRRGSCECPGL